MQQSSAKDAALIYKRNRWITGVFVIAILIFGTVTALTGQTGSVTAQVDTAMLGVIGTYGSAEFVPLDEIEEFRLTETMDFGSRIEGEETKNTMSGRYSNEEFGEYLLHVYPEKEPYLVVRYSQGKTLVFNLGGERLTKSIFKDLEEALGS